MDAAAKTMSPTGGAANRADLRKTSGTLFCLTCPQYPCQTM
jgi:hypothetical protein